MKDNFLLKTTQINVFKELSDEDAGKLINSLKLVVDNEERYEAICERNRTNGKLGGRPKTQQNPKNPVGILETQQNPKNPDNDNDYDNDIYIKEKNIKKKKSFDNLDVDNLFCEFLELRKKLKCKNTDRAINLLINKLNEYDDATKIEMLNNAIMNSWKSVYPIKEFKQNKKDKFSGINQAIKEVYDGTIILQ